MFAKKNSLLKLTDLSSRALFCRFLGLYMKLDLPPRCPPHRVGPRRWAVQRQKYSLRIYTTAKWTRRWLRYMAIRHAKRAPRAASRAPRAAYRALVRGVWQLDTARRGAGHGAIALRESYIQYVPRDDLNKEERREIKYRDYWFQTRRKVAGHGFSFFLQRLCSSSRIV